MSFRGAHCVRPQTLQRTGFDVPAGLDLTDHTVMLDLTVKASPLGRLLDPCIEMGDGQQIQRQYFQRNSTGRHYLNLSPLFRHHDSTRNRRVALRGRGIAWESNATLLAFDPPELRDATVLVLAPHPDDAEIASFGMYSRAHSWVVTITAGEKGTGSLPKEIPVSERARWAAWLRVWDSLSVPALGSVPMDRRLNLVYPDGSLEPMCRQPRSVFHLACESSLPRRELRRANQVPQFQQGGADCTWDALVQELGRLLELIGPDIVICPHPLIDSHADHIFTTLALERALRGFAGQPPRIFLYVVHSRALARFPPGPAQSLVCLPPMDDLERAADALYSHPLEPQRQRAKYFAIEAMHATRSTSLLRRAPRPNEIYYIVGQDRLSEMTRQVLP